MTKENIFKNYTEDSLLIEKEYLTIETKNELRFNDHSGVKLIEVIKLAINGVVDGDNEGVIKNKIQKYLN